MRIFTISVLSVFAVIPAFANVRLPVVNVGGAGISARAAFGEQPSAKNPIKENKIIAQATGGQDILVPKRPSGDLWARNEKPLRMPEPSEFSVINSNYELPEESLNKAKGKRQKAEVFAQQDSNLDAEIANMVELRRKADKRAPSTLVSYDARPMIAERAGKLHPLADISVRKDFGISEEARDEKVLARVVIPMESKPSAKPVPSARPVSVNDSSLTAGDNGDSTFSKMSSSELKKAFKKTYMSENKHLSTYQIDERFDVVSDFSSNIEGFSSARDLSEAGGVRPLEIKLGFHDNDSALSRDNFNLLTEYASIVVSNPKRAIQVSIPERTTRSLDDRRLAARRLAIVEQVLRDVGVSDKRIMPVLSQRNDDSFVLRVISSDQFETLTQQKRDMFGDNVGSKTYKSMSW